MGKKITIQDLIDYPERKYSNKENWGLKLLPFFIAIGFSFIFPFNYRFQPPKIEQQITFSRPIKKESSFEFNYSPSMLGDPNSVGFVSTNYQKGDMFIEALINFSNPQKESKTLFETMQVKLRKPRFEIRYNRRSFIDGDNKKVFSEWWHVYKDNITIIDMDGDKIPDVIYNQGEFISFDPNRKDHEIYNKNFSNCLKYYHEKIYEKDGNLETIISR